MRTVQRFLAENNLSVMVTYSKVTDEELDDIVAAIKNTMPHAGNRVINRAPLARGHRVQN